MKAVLFANTDWYLYNFRLAYAVFLQKQGWEVVFVSPDGEYAAKLKEEGFRHIPFAFSRKGINPLQENETILRIKNLYEIEKPDLVHHFTIKCVIYGSMAAKDLGIKAIVNSITGLGYMFLSNKPHIRVIRETEESDVRRADRFLSRIGLFALRFRQADQFQIGPLRQAVRDPQAGGSGAPVNEYPGHKQPSGMHTSCIIYTLFGENVKRSA